MIRLFLVVRKELAFNFRFWIAVAVIIFIAVIYYNWFEYERFWRFSIFEFKNDIIGSLFLIPFLYASIVFSWKGALLIWLIAMATNTPRMIYYSYQAAELARNIGLALVPLMIVLTITFELKWRERQKQILVEREKERQLYLSQILKAQEEERQRIARELHDGTIQELLAIANRAQTVITANNNKVAMIKNVEWMRDTTLHISEDLRRLSLDLRPSILDDIGLVPALRWLLDRLNKESKIKTKFMMTGIERKLDSETEVTIFRIIQEALNNVRRHSDANDVLITIKYAPEGLEISVRDNGKGFSFDKTISKLAAKNKLGIMGMQQRVKVINGTLDIQSSSDRGTSVLIKIINPVDSPVQ